MSQRDGPWHEPSHGHAHRSLRFDDAAAARQSIHRVGRRRFLADLGRNGFAVAILGGVVAACSDSDDTPGAGETTGTTGRPTGPTDATTGPNEQPGTTLPSVGSLTWEQVSLGFVSAYVLARGNSATLVDTGTAGSVNQIGETLRMLALTYDDVDHVVLTHHHPDHIGSLPDVMAEAQVRLPTRASSTSPTFPGPTSPRSATATRCSGCR